MNLLEIIDHYHFLFRNDGKYNADAWLYRFAEECLMDKMLIPHIQGTRKNGLGKMIKRLKVEWKK